MDVEELARENQNVKLSKSDMGEEGEEELPWGELSLLGKARRVVTSGFSAFKTTVKYGEEGTEGEREREGERDTHTNTAALSFSFFLAADRFLPGTLPAILGYALVADPPASILDMLNPLPADKPTEY